MKTVYEWLGEYQLSHRNPINKTLHWVCIPPIVFSVLGLLRLAPLGDGWINGATLGAAVALVYYALLSWRLTLGMLLPFALLCALIEWSYRTLGVSAHAGCMIAVFVLAWIGQFIGHQVEGVKPSFFKDLQFLLIGPLWLLADIYRRSGLPVAPR